MERERKDKGKIKEKERKEKSSYYLKLTIIYTKYLYIETHSPVYIQGKISLGHFTTLAFCHLERN